MDVTVVACTYRGGRGGDSVLLYEAVAAFQGARWRGRARGRAGGRRPDGQTGGERAEGYSRNRANPPFKILRGGGCCRLQPCLRKGLTPTTFHAAMKGRYLCEKVISPKGIFCVSFFFSFAVDASIIGFQ